MKLTNPGMSVLCAAGAVLSLFGGGQQALAANLNTSGDACVREGSDWIRCPLIRSPIASGSTAAFYIDGYVWQPGTSILCGVYSDDFTGLPLAVRTFTYNAETRFDAYVSFTTTEVPYWAYVSLLCQMTKDSRGFNSSNIIGVTAVQPEGGLNVASASGSDTEVRASQRSAFNAHVAATARSFDNQVRDQRWSSETSALLESVLSGADMQAIKVKGIDCRTTTCRVEIENTGLPETATQLHKFVTRTAGAFSATTMQQPAQAGSKETLALYLSRENKG